MSLGPAEILVVLVIALVVFGPKRLPEVGRQVGGALRELRKVQDTVQSEIRTVSSTTRRHRCAACSRPNPPARSCRRTSPPRAALPPAEPDLGDETNDLDGLSGGTFS